MVSFSSMSNGSRHCPTLWVVEDQPGTRWALVQHMSRAGFSVTGIESAEQAMRRFDDGERPDVVLADLHLPGRDGLWLLEKVMHDAPNLKGVLITAHAGPDGTPPPGVERLHLPWLQKPFDMPRLIGILKAPQSLPA
jgi:DNA-binding NtrC family response regulator